MVACAANLQTMAFEAESSWAEDVDTMTTGIQLCEPVSIAGITQAMLAPERVLAYRNSGSKGIPGPQSNITVTATSWLTGRGSTSAGSVTETDLSKYLYLVLGGHIASPASGTTYTGGTANIATTTTSGTFSAGQLVRSGEPGDGRGGGQFQAIASHVTTNMTFLTNLAVAASNGDKLYSPDVVYAAPSSCSLTGTRLRVQTADIQFILHGCFPTAFSITQTSPGEVPKISVTWQASWAEPVAGTFPTTPNAGTVAPRVIAGATSLFFNTVGTATFATLAARRFTIGYQLGIDTVKGTGLVGAYQTIAGARRINDNITLGITVDANGASTTPTYWDEWLANTAKHVLMTWSSDDGAAVGVYFPNCCYTANRPSQAALNNLNAIDLSLMAYNGSTTTSDLTQSAMRIAMA